MSMMIVRITAAFKMQNTSRGMNKNCLSAYSSSDEGWKCISPTYAEPYTTSSLFALNSIYDSWQLANILELPCKPPSCSPTYMEDIVKYGEVSKESLVTYIVTPRALVQRLHDSSNQAQTWLTRLLTTHLCRIKWDTSYNIIANTRVLMLSFIHLSWLN